MSSAAGGFKKVDTSGGDPGDRGRQGRARPSSSTATSGSSSPSRTATEVEGSGQDPGRLHRGPASARSSTCSTSTHRPSSYTDSVPRTTLAGVAAHQLPADRHPGPAVPVLLQPDAGRRLPGHAVRQVQGQADHQGHPEDDLRRRRRRRRGRRGARRDQGVPRGPGEVPGRRRQDPQGRAALRPARHRQDAAGPRRRRRGRRARSTRSPARTSSRCSSVSVPPGSATCSSRPRPTPRPSSSSTRSTPSAGTAAPASAAATTSASRPSTSCWSRWTASTSRAASS